MCIAIAKPRGIDRPSNEILTECFKNNKDGAGFSFAINGKVHIMKGYMKLEDLITAVESLEKFIKMKDTSMLFHFRIGTQGGNVEGNTHPFPLSDVEEELKSTLHITDMAMIHNGIISKTSGSEYRKKFPNLSDTQIFCSEFLKEMKDVYGYDKMFDSKLVNAIISEFLGSGKFAFLDKDGAINTYGEWIEDNGIFYSNKTYKESKWLNVGGKNVYKGGSCYNGYYDDFDYSNYKYNKQAIEKELEIVNDKQKVIEFTDINDDYFNAQSSDIVPVINTMLYDFYDSNLKLVHQKDLKVYGKLYMDSLGIIYIKDDFGYLENGLYAEKVLPKI